MSYWIVMKNRKFRKNIEKNNSFFYVNFIVETNALSVSYQD